MKENWQPYPRGRKIVDRGQYVLIVPESFEGKESSNVPLFCEVCGIRFNDKEDEKSFFKFKCCATCADTWAYSNKEKWENGWRPSKQQVSESLDSRSFISSDLIFE